MTNLPTKGRDTDRPHLNHRATSRLYSLSETSLSSDAVLPSSNDSLVA